MADDLPVLLLEDAAAFEAWLDANPEADGAWLLIAKKNGKVPTVAYAEAVQVSLCNGWIDSQVRRHDDDCYQQRFTPRRKRSPWSQINREHAERLIAEGRMRPAGLAQVEAAKADGRWELAYAPPSTAEVPDDLAAAMAANPDAAAAFAAFNKQNRYALVHRLSQLRKPETRARRIADFVTKVADGWKPYP